MAEQPGPGAGRRPAELSLQELEREARRLLRVADLEERRSAARARDAEALKAELALLRAQQKALELDLSARPIDLDAFEKRLDALAASLERIRLGTETTAGGSLSARIARRGPDVEPEDDGDAAAEDLARDHALARSGAGGRWPTPVPAPPPVLVHLRFTPPAALPGGRVVLQIDAPGFPDGAEVLLEVWDRAREHLFGEQHVLVDTEAIRAEIAVPLAALPAGGLFVRARAGRADAWSPPLEVAAPMAAT